MTKPRFLLLRLLLASQPRHRKGFTKSGPELNLQWPRLLWLFSGGAAALMKQLGSHETYE